MPKKNPKHRAREMARQARGLAPVASSNRNVRAWQKKTFEIQQKYLDILQNIEFAVVHLHQEAPGLTDYDVIDVYRYFLRELTARMAGKRVNQLPLETIRFALALLIIGVLHTNPTLALPSGEYLTGIAADLDAFFTKVVMDEHAGRALRESIACLLHSARFWNENNPDGGYLEYVGSFFRQTS